MHALYYTDPLCPWSWALEPARRRLQREFGQSLRITFVMGGMRSELEDPVSVARQALEASDVSRMPVDVRLWLRDAPRTSHPACIAVKAAAEQGDPEPYLRRLRTAVLCRQRRLEAADELVAEARAIPGLDIGRFKLDLGSNAVLESFAADLERARSVAEEHHSAGSGRVKLPSLELRGPDGSLHGFYGYGDYEELAAAARAAGARPGGDDPPSIEAALRHQGPLATVEAAAVCELPLPAAAAQLWQLALQWRVEPERVGSGELWHAA